LIGDYASGLFINKSTGLIEGKHQFMCVSSKFGEFRANYYGVYREPRAAEIAFCDDQFPN
jgi:hypothetical protein